MPSPHVDCAINYPPEERRTVGWLASLNYVSVFTPKQHVKRLLRRRLRHPLRGPPPPVMRVEPPPRLLPGSSGMYLNDRKVHASIGRANPGRWCERGRRVFREARSAALTTVAVGFTRRRPW